METRTARKAIIEITLVCMKCAHIKLSFYPYNLVMDKKKIYFYPKGRLGNALFRYFAIVLVLQSNPVLSYGGINVRGNNNVQTLGDNLFKELISNNIFELENINTDLIFDGFYQIQEISNYKETIKLFLQNNQQDIIFNYPYEEFKIRDIVNQPIKLNIYDIVIHIRLEDFIENQEYISSESILNLLNNISPSFFCDNTVAIVMNKQVSSFEIRYVDNLKKWFYDNNICINIESNDILRDFHIMKNAKKLICSNSTISWCAALLSDKIEICYMPDYQYREDRTHQTFKYPIKHTVLYPI